MSKKKLKAAFEAGRNTELSFKEWYVKKPKYEIGDVLQANAGGYAFNQDGLEFKSALTSLPSRNNHCYDVCTRVTYSELHKIYFYKLGSLQNMFTENCIKRIKL